MSLLVWMPLNGNLTNQGLGSVNASASTAEYSDVTKFNKSLNLKSANISFTVSELANQRIFSIAFWIYCQSNSSYTRDWNAAIRLGDGTSQLRFESTYSSSPRGLSFHNNIDNRITAASRILAQDKDKWYHVALVCDGTKIYSYTDGVNTFTDAANGGTMDGGVYINQKTYYGFMNDLRIYDHALSNKEVEELSKGLCCHYPLNDPYCTTSINKYSGDAFDGKPSSYSSDKFTVTKLADERGYNFKMSYTGTGSDTWACIQYPVASFTAGKTYDYSCKIRVHKTNTNITMRTARMANDWEKGVINVASSVNENWKEYHARIKLEATSTRSGTSMTTKPLVEFYTPSLKTSGTVFTLDFDIKDVQFAECESDAPATNGAFADSVVYDTSGFGNNGSITKTESISINSDSPVNNTCYKFLNGGNACISLPNFFFEKMREGTINIWINRHSTDTTWRTYVFFANGYSWTGTEQDFIIIGSTGSQAITMDCCSNTSAITPELNKWYMYTITWNLVNHTAVFYSNGSRISSVTNSRIDTTYAAKHNSHYLGCSLYDKADYSLSDFRIYAKALSATQVMELYNAPVSISNNGTLITKGEFVE